MKNPIPKYREGDVVRVISKVSRNRGRIGTVVNHCKGNYPDIITVRFSGGDTARFFEKSVEKEGEKIS